MLLLRPSHVPDASISPLAQHCMSRSRTRQQVRSELSSAMQQLPWLSRLPLQPAGTWQYVPCMQRHC